MTKIITAAVTCILSLNCFAVAEHKQQLFTFDNAFNIGKVDTSDSKVSLTAKGLRIKTGHSTDWPGITLKAPNGKWNATEFQTISVDITNLSDKETTVNCRVDNPGANGRDNCITGHILVEPKQTQTLVVRMQNRWALDEPLKLIGMRGYPAGINKIDPSNITQLLFFINKPDVDHDFAVNNITLKGKTEPLPAKNFLPFIDQFGQFKHSTWPGKTASIADMKNEAAKEATELATAKPNKNLNKYGGWKTGPQLKATGFFRVEKHNGKWWLVDPAGNLFWSHGIDCVHPSTWTPISDREHYFESLPAEGTEFAKFYGRGSWAPHGYYKDHTPYRTYDLCKANLLRKYGSDWQNIFADLTHKRLRYWGLNTIANWSDGNIYKMRRTPYTATIGFSSKNIEGSQGYWGKFYDVFDPSFRDNMRKSMKRQANNTANDPWCIGYFVHNEIAWGDDISLAVATLKSPADQPAKKVFIKDLKVKYKTIASLNSAWGTDHASWKHILESSTEPDKKKAKNDLNEFYKKIADTYFTTIRQELKAVAPNQLYMGCRFAWVNDTAARSAATHCDIVCYNRYHYSVADLALPDKIDKPIIIGEFHFGALDRGMFHTGLKAAKDQNDRAQKYKEYVQGALKNQYIVGTHWFQYKDQATTGRGDGENYQIGFLNICDTPYPEIVNVAQEIGSTMYKYRSN